MKNNDKIPIQEQNIIDTIKEQYNKNKHEILKSTLDLTRGLETETLHTQMYDMKMNLNYKNLYDKMKTFINKN